MRLLQKIKHLEQYKPNKSVLKDYFGYESKYTDGYVTSKITGDMSQNADYSKFELIQRFVLFAYQTIMGIVSRKNKYRAD